MIIKKTLPRFFNKNRNSLVFFRNVALVNALKNHQILLFFPTFNFSGSQWLDLRRELFSVSAKACTFAAAPAFSIQANFVFCSTNNHFIVGLPNAAVFSNIANLLRQKQSLFLPTIVFFGSSCVNIYNQTGFASLHEIFLDQLNYWHTIINILSTPVLQLAYFFMCYFSYFCFIVINSLLRALVQFSNYCFYLRT